MSPRGGHQPYQSPMPVNCPGVCRQFPAIMPLAQGDKCRGFGGRATKEVPHPTYHSASAQTHTRMDCRCGYGFAGEA